MSVKIVKTNPFQDQSPGTSGLRKKTRVFMQPHYLENFVQSVLNSVAPEDGSGFKGKTLVIGGDGRYYNRQAAQVILKIAAANGFSRILLARSVICSTPAVSAVIRAEHAFGGFVLSASHNAGGIDEDFGIKYNSTNGGPAPEQITKRVFSESKQLAEYRILDTSDIDLDHEGTILLGETEVIIFNPVTIYSSLMENIFDFNLLSELFRQGFNFRFDAMHAVTGPYAIHIFEKLLKAPRGTVLNGIPLEDFGGGHPDPNQVHAKGLIDLLNTDPSITLGAASDGDGDRNMIIGPEFFVSPGDSLALITENFSKIPRYAQGITGVARSMPTSTAVDRVATKLEIPCFETPTGWKYFCNLMEAGLCTFCGEESFGTGSNHVTEKDGLWAVLCWLTIIAHHQTSVQEIVHTHWNKFGRCCFQRHDYENLDKSKAEEIINIVRKQLPHLPGQNFAGLKIKLADDFSYTDPVDGSKATNQGIRIILDDSSRVVFRLSGTGTEGATLRIYFDSYRSDAPKAYAGDILLPLIKETERLLELKERFGREQPNVIT